MTNSTIAELSRDPAELATRLAGSFPELALDAVRIARAPGRVNLIGEHTDYNDGLVLPVAIDLGVSIAFVPTADRRVEVVLAATSERDGFDLDSIGPRRGASIDYLAGVALVLAAEGVATTGFRGFVAADLPVGAGLGSSAALELAASLALTAGGASSIDPMDLARLAQRAENEYVGVRCGLMDQFAAVSGRSGHALLLDCRSLEHRGVSLPTDEIAIVVCHTGSPRRLESSAYNARRAECDRALAGLTALDPSIRSLRDATPELLEAARDRLDEVAFRRARHVVTENVRVRTVVDALEVFDPDALRPAFAESHASLRDDFEVGAPELDALVEIARATPGVIASRQTGAGFGGCTVSLVRPDAVTGFRERILAEYPGRTGREPTTWEVSPADGVALLA